METTNNSNSKAIKKESLEGKKAKTRPYKESNLVGKISDLKFTKVVKKNDKNSF